ncbi:MAG: HlyD family efflux transporter periplasmic adaptor subunit [Bryobacteraceae bacterium]|nr:HlyD family efflux transporter periplasmic adaptor subunit [Bryobacteraceae bacterium]
MMKARQRIALVAALAAAGIAAWRLMRDRAQDSELRLSGNIELTEIALSFKLPGRVEELLVDEGAVVRAGQVIARQDTAELERQREREAAAAEAAGRAVEQARAAVAYQEKALQQEIALRRAELEAAEKRLEELRRGSRPQEVQAAEAALREAEAAFALAERDWARAQTLHRNEDISAAQYDQFRTRFEASRAALERAREQVSLVREGPRREQVEQQAAAVERARAALRLAEAGAMELERRRRELAMREAERERAKAQLAVVEVQLAERVLRSPVDGIVLSKSAERGEVVAGGATVVTIGDMARPWLRGYIGERYLGRVKPGMRADVRTDSYPDRTYPGKVTFISSEAEFTPKQIQTEEERQKLVYRIKIELENPRLELKLNMPADAVLRLE